MIFTPLSSPLVRCINPNSFQKIELLTDHFIIEFSINLKFTKIKRKRIAYRDFKSIDLPTFVNNIKTEISSSTSLCPVLLNSTLLNIINIRTKTILITDSPFSSWFSHELFIFKKSVRKFENKFLKNPYTETKLALSLVRKNYKYTISRSKSIYYNKKMVLNSSDPRKLFKIANKLSFLQMKKSSPFYQIRQIVNCVLFLKNSLKIKLQALIILFAHLLHPY